MAGDHESEADDEMLRDFLRGQRESVVAIVAGHLDIARELLDGTTRLGGR